MDGQYNTQNPAVKRLMREALEMQQNPNELFLAGPLEENLFEWHFTIRGPSESDFDGGIFHGRIMLPADYPMKPPNIVMLTPNGRFETNKKICLSISGHHPESWQPCWSIRTALLAIIGFMPSPGAGAVGALDMSSEDRKLIAKKSLDWRCVECNLHMRNALPPLTNASSAMRNEAEQLAKQISSASGDNNANSAPPSNERSNAAAEEQQQQSETAANNQSQRSTASRQAVQQELRRRLLQQASPSGAGGSSYPSDTSFRAERYVLDAVLIFVCLLLFALVLRRLYIQNEWRFYQ